MLFSDQYREPVAAAEASLRERGSRFLGYAWPVFAEDEVKARLQDLRLKYPDATHHCYAWVLHPDKSAQRFQDDGEPSNTAGRPILRAIQAADLTNVLVLVVRYFGGTLLGVPGLIQAYGDCAALVLREVKVIEKYIEDEFMLTTDFANENQIHRLIQTFEARVLGSEYTDKVTYTLAIRRMRSVEFASKAKDNYLIECKNIR